MQDRDGVGLVVVSWEEAACPRGAPYRNHGAYVSCVSHAAEGLFDDGVIAEFEKDAIVSEAGRSEVGKRH